MKNKNEKLLSKAERLAKVLGISWSPEGSSPESPTPNFSHREGLDIQEKEASSVKVNPPLPGTLGSRDKEAKTPVGGVCKAHGQGPKALLKLLREIAIDLLPSRDLRRRVALVTLHLPLELLALHLGVSRQSIWSWGKLLRAKGLLEHTPFKVRLPDGRVVNSGTLFLVPLRKVSSLRFIAEDFDLDREAIVSEMAAGKLSYAWKRSGLRPSFEILVAWAKGQRITPGQPPPVPMTTIFDLVVLAQDPEKRRTLPALITLLADQVARVLQDFKSRRYFAGLLWKVARGEISPDFVFSLVIRTIEGFREGALRRPGAFLAKQAGRLAGDP